MPLTPHQEIEALREKLALAYETIRQLQEELCRPIEHQYRGLKLTKTERALVGMLLSTNGLCTKERLYAGLYLSTAGTDLPDAKIIDVFVCKLRPKLEPHGIDIGTVWGRGYIMPNESKERLEDLKTAVVEHPRSRTATCSNVTPSPRP